MLQGPIVAESHVPLTVRKIERIDAGPTEQPPQWTLLWFDAADEDADRLAEALSSALEARGGWYADFHSESEVTVVFSDRIFRYRRGDKHEWAGVEDYARSVAVPDEQLGWAE
jgi:hypothetical protein